MKKTKISDTNPSEKLFLEVAGDVIGSLEGLPSDLSVNKKYFEDFVNVKCKQINYTLEQCLEAIIDYRGKAPIKSDQGIILITARNVRKGFIDFSNLEYIPEENYQTWMTRGIPKEGDLLFTTEAPMGNIAMFPSGDIRYALAQRLVTLRPNTKIVDGKYLMYYLLSKKGQQEIYQRHSGTTALGISQKQVLKINVSLPPIHQQKKIAEILATWDEAIALTEKAIKAKYYFKQTIKKKLLERKFKNYQEDNKINDWMIKKLDDVAIFQNGKAHENYVVEDGKFIIINSKFISTEGKVIKYSDKQLLPLKKDDIVMVMSDVPNGKALAKFFYIEEDNKFTLNQRICLLRTKNINSRYLFYFLDKN